MKRFILLFLVLAAWASGNTWYVSDAGTTPFNGAQATPWRYSDFNNIANWSTGASGTQIAPGDTVRLVGTFTHPLTVQRAGTSTAARTIITGDGTLTSSGATVSWSGTTVLVGINVGFANISILRCEITQSGTPSYRGIDVAAAGILIEDNYIHDTYNCAISRTTSPDSASNLIVRHNWFYSIGSVGNGAGEGGEPEVIGQISGNAILVEYNTIYRSMDRVRLFGRGCVVRNNYWGATNTTYYPSSSPQPYHTDGFQSYENVSWPLTQFLYEANYDTDNFDSIGGTNAHGMNVQDGSGASPGVNMNWYLDRFNVLIRPGGGARTWQNVRHTYLQNNTFIAINNQAVIGGIGTTGDVAGWTYPTQFSNASTAVADVRNLTLSYSPQSLGNNVSGSSGPIEYLPATSFTAAALHGYNVTGSQINYPAGSTSNLTAGTDPKFTDGLGTIGHDDYTLQVTSPLRGAGLGYLTASGAGVASTTLTVTASTGPNPSEIICDGTTGSGWPGIDADSIKVGSNAYQRVVSVNTSTNVVTLSSAITWSNGDAVIVKGQEDIGALPYSYALPASTPQTVAIVNTTLPSGANTFTATVGTTAAARGVEWLVDGLPIGIVYDSPYSQAYTSDGATHTVEARCLSKWAAATMTLSAAKTLSPAASAGGSSIGGKITFGGTVKLQ